MDLGWRAVEPDAVGGGVLDVIQRASDVSRLKRFQLLLDHSRNRKRFNVWGQGGRQQSESQKLEKFESNRGKVSKLTE
ncbi:MAG: hypothetical protein CSA70_02170 [Rhodobacterales bacterium]|nr:MAG: hypothetical protein CSA70_02170 [Rhodobacterales bacterium]